MGCNREATSREEDGDRRKGSLGVEMTSAGVNPQFSYSWTDWWRGAEAFRQLYESERFGEDLLLHRERGERMLTELSTRQRAKAKCWCGHDTYELIEWFCVFVRQMDLALWEGKVGDIRSYVDDLQIVDVVWRRLQELGADATGWRCRGQDRLVEELTGMKDRLERRGVAEKQGR